MEENRSRTIYWTQLWSVKRDLATGLSAQISRSSGQVMLLRCCLFVFFFFYVFFFFVCLFVCFLIVAFSFTQFVSGFLYFNITSCALIPRRSTAHREGRRISFV
jgi:hypothetical protein